MRAEWFGNTGIVDAVRSMRLVPCIVAVLEESPGTFFTFLLPTTSDSKVSEYPRLNITKESMRENSEQQNLLCYKN